MASRDELLAVARDLKDFDLYDAANDIDMAWKYLKAIKEHYPKIAEKDISNANVENKTVEKTVKANYQRYRKLQILKEDRDADYRAIYESEIELLNDYLYKAIGDIVKEAHPEAWQKMLAAHAEELQEKEAKRNEYKQKNALKLAQKREKHLKESIEIARKALEEKEAKLQETQAEIEELQEAEQE